MTPEQLAAAKSIVQYAAVNSLETDEVMLLGHALQEIDRLRAELDRLSAHGVEVPELTEEDENAARNEWAKGSNLGTIRFGYDLARSRVRPAPPHPDTVEVQTSKAAFDRAALKMMTAYKVLRRESPKKPHADIGWMEDLLSVGLDALRAPAQPATEREGA